MTISSPVAVCIEVLDHAFCGDEPLVAMERGGYVGSMRGTIAMAVFSLGDEV